MTEEIIIHQVWIGELSPPILWMNTVKQFCKKYKYKYILWNDELVSSLELVNDSLYKEMRSKKLYAGAVDVLRYEILYQYGGVYIDADTVILKPERFHTFLRSHTSTVFFGCETDSCDLYANGTLGTPPNSPFFKDLVQQLSEYASNHKTEDVWKRTGPYFLTDFVKYRTQKDYTTIPKDVFYPMGWHNITDPWKHTKVKVPEESLLFQYGYSTNKFNSIFQFRRNIYILLIALLYICLYINYTRKNRYSIIILALLVLGLSGYGWFHCIH